MLATHCNTLQHTATHCNTLQHTATHCNTLQHNATHTHCSTLQLPDYPRFTLLVDNRECLQRTATHCNTLQLSDYSRLTLPVDNKECLQRDSFIFASELKHSVINVTYIIIFTEDYHRQAEMYHEQHLQVSETVTY